MSTINPQIFREYDIRGIVDKDLDEDVINQIGKAYGTYVKSMGTKTVALGRDCRMSSPGYSGAITQGINSTGIDVIDIGMVSTPMLYFSLFNLDVEGGVMITASHNPSEYNGVKLSAGTNSVYGEGIQDIRRIAESGQFARGTGNQSTHDIGAEYVDYLKNNLDIEPGIKVALDYGNGMVGLMGPSVFREFGCDVTELYEKPDGTFPNHHPDPTVEENLVELRDAVINSGSEVGLGFDGDGDRVGALDEYGRIVWGDMLVLIYAREILERNPGATIIGDVKCSGRLFKDIESRGGKAIMWKTGHSLIKSKMKEEGALLAGEMSGHIFFADRYYGYDDALYGALRLVEIVSKTGKKVSELLDGVPHAITTPEIRVDTNEDIKFELVRGVAELLDSDFDVINTDGVRIEFPDGWGLIRASNTQPALVLRFEAENEQRLSEIRAVIEGALDRVKADLS